MKKFFAFAAAAMMLASCVVSEEANYNRTDYDLVNYTSRQINSSVDVTLRNLRSYSGINAEGFKCTGTVDSDVQPVITRVGDNVWTSVYEDSSLKFSVNVRRVEGEDELEEKWFFSGLELACSEEGGFSFSLVTEDEVKYTWERDGRAFTVEYNLVPTGTYKARFFRDGKELDWCNVSYTEGDMGSSSSAKGR